MPATGVSVSEIIAMDDKSQVKTLPSTVVVALTSRGAVLSDGTTIDIDLHVTVMYGVSLPAVAQNAVSNVKYRVEDLTGLHVRNVNIFVEAIKV